MVYSLLSDTDILSIPEMIKPLYRPEKKTGISRGLSSFGYDATLANTFVTTATDDLIDPKKPKEILSFLETTHEKNPYIIEPHQFVLAHTEETFHIPNDVFVICMGKSTYARCGLFVNVTPLEPGWSGQVTLELYNSTNCELAIYPGEGICQFVFFKGNIPEKNYTDMGGKYHNQQGVTLPR